LDVLLFIQLRHSLDQSGSSKLSLLAAVEGWARLLSQGTTSESYESESRIWEEEEEQSLAPINLKWVEPSKRLGR
jgi:hypothetical protein